MTAQHDDDDDLMPDTDEDTQIMATSPLRAARDKVLRAAAAAKEVLANGSSANGGSANGGPAPVVDVRAEKDAAAGEVPALPADTIGAPRDSSSLSFGRSVAAPVAPDDDWALGDGSLSS
ncbi:MAG TPA: hypothetical protein VJ347_21945, partial [Streptosporangiaceae bacterium]|nr:hypothetical protein [Streptosporangiaceae bacterium]